MYIFLDDQWFQLIGKDLQAVKSTIDELVGCSADLAVKIPLNKYSSYNFYKQGISITVVKKTNGQVEIIDSIDFYLLHKSYNKPLCQLPFHITDALSGKALIELFGEPLEKGGGMNNGLNIWLRWEHLQIELNGKSWNDGAGLGIKSITIFDQ